MMARTNKSRRSYSTGEWGRNRVRVFPDPRTGIIQVQWREDGRRISRSLKHRDWDRAKKQADEIAAGLTETVAAKTTDAEPEPLTLHTLFDPPLFTNGREARRREAASALDSEC